MATVGLVTAAGGAALAASSTALPDVTALPDSDFAEGLGGLSGALPIATATVAEAQAETLQSTADGGKEHRGYLCISPRWSHQHTPRNVQHQGDGWPPRTVAACSAGKINAAAATSACEQRIVTLGVLYYNSPALLHNIMRGWATWPESLAHQFHFTVVDDCSTSEHSALSVVRANKPMYPIRVLTIQPPKIAWNNVGALNLLMHAATTCWAMRLDADVVVTPQAARGLLGLAERSDIDRVHMFNRENIGSVHPANRLFHRQAYWRAGGSDEDFAGSYGYEDAQLGWMLSQSGAKFRRHRDVNLTQVIHVARLQHYPANFSRDSTHNLELHLRKQKGLAPLPTLYLRFRWHANTVTKRVRRGSRRSL